MSGPEHYAEAEALLRYADSLQHEDYANLGGVLTAAQVHATLALAAATVAPRAFGPQESWGGHAIEAGPDWQEATS